MDQLKQ